MIMATFITFCLFIMIVSTTAFLDRQLAVSREPNILSRVPSSPIVS